MKVITYIDSPAIHAELECAPRPRLVYRCWIDKGPGFSENVRLHYGPDTCGKVKALWVSSDWAITKCAVAWTKDKKLPTSPWIQMLRVYWEAEKVENGWEEPNYTEIDSSPASLMKPDQIETVARSVWPDRKV